MQTQKQKEEEEAKKLLPSRLDVQPGVPMKRLHWTQIPPTAALGTIWANVDERQMCIDEEEFESMFCAKVVEKKEKGDDKELKKSEEEADAKKVKLIDSKRSYEVDIGLSRFRGLSYTDIRTAVVDLNTRVLTPEKLRSLSLITPTPEEAAMVLACEESDDKLGQSEQFFKCLSVVPHVRVRMGCFMFKQQFPALIESVEEGLRTVVQAVTSIHRSENLKLVFQYILRFGNYMNAGSNAGKAYGFKLSTLQRLQATKTIDNKTTLLHYVIEHVGNDKPSAYDFVNEISSVFQAR